MWNNQATKVTDQLNPIHEWDNVDFDIFHNEIVKARQPAVIKSFKNDFLLKKIFNDKNNFLQRNISTSGRQYRAAILDSAFTGKYHYEQSLTGLNFQCNAAPLGVILAHLTKSAGDKAAPSIYVSGISPQEYFANSAEYEISLLNKAVNPSITLANNFVLQPFYETTDYLGFIISGARNVIVFPPGQISNLYLGPLEYAVEGQAMSQIDITDINMDRFPAMEEALATAQYAELHAGDLIFIPGLWLRSFMAPERFNAHMSYQFYPVASAISASNALLHGLLTISHLPLEEREAWEVFFDRYVFNAYPEFLDHIPEDSLGVLGDMTPENFRKMWAFLAHSMGITK